MVQGGERVGLWGRNKGKWWGMGDDGHQTQVLRPKKRHTPPYSSPFPLSSAHLNAPYRTLTHPISHPLTLTPTRADKWSTREEKNKKIFRSPFFRLFFSRYNNSSYFSVFFYIQNININLYLCVFFIFDKDQLPIKR